MPEPDGVKIARIDERLAGLKVDVAELAAEQQRARTRLHQLEGFAQAYLDVQKQNRRSEARQYRRLEVRLQLLAVVVALAAVVVPIVVAVLHGR